MKDTGTTTVKVEVPVEVWRVLKDQAKGEGRLWKWWLIDELTKLAAQYKKEEV